MKKIVLIMILIGCSKISIGQFYDRTWLVGGITQMNKLTFNSSVPDTSSLHWINPQMGVIRALSNVSDTNGSLLFFTNGIVVFDTATNIMENGDTLTAPLFYDQFIQNGLTEPQTNLILPKSGNTFYLFYFSQSDSLLLTQTYAEPDQLLYAVVDMNANSGRGKVISKRNLAYKGLFGDCRLTACRHANGRDWWLVHQGFENDEYFIYLITPDSVYSPRIQHIGPSDFFADNPGAQSVFSPDGSKFATTTSYGPLLIMDFDRCTGTFSNSDTMPVLSSVYTYNGQNEGIVHGSPGCSFSSNGRYLYLTNSFDIWQYDIAAANVAASAMLVGRWDTSGPANGFWSFYNLYLLPNGKIVIGNFEGGSNAFHLIENPDVAGAACNLLMRGLPVNTQNATALPNMINYRLGPLIGSGCDTIAGLSSVPGIVNGIHLFPNPALDVIHISASQYHTGTSLNIYDDLGREVYYDDSFYLDADVDIRSFASGLYIVRLHSSTGDAQSKFVKE